MRLDSYLVHCGLGSKKEMKIAIKQGRISVNGIFVKQPNAVVCEQEDRVVFNNHQVHYEKYYYYAYHKPKGVVCAKEDKYDKTIYDLLPKELNNQGVFSVGRLDKDTTGLLLLTTDGKWDHTIRHPKTEKEKSYFFIYSGKLCDRASEMVKEGLDLGDFKTLPGELILLGESCARLVIKEGKFHQVKRMVHKLGGEIVTLHRESIGSVSLGDLALGEYRQLDKDEVALLGEITR